jgi:hypothetical protein
MLEKLDTVCRQAQELSAEIKQKMAQTRRDEFQSADSASADRRTVTRKQL